MIIFINYWLLQTKMPSTRVYNYEERGAECCAICGGCCLVFFGILLALGGTAMTALGIYYVTDNAAAAAGPDPRDGWTNLVIYDTRPGFAMPITGLCGFNTEYGGYNTTCTYPATGNNTCGVPPMEYAITYYKTNSFPPEFHCGEIKSNYENVRKRNMGIALLVAPYGFAFLIVIIYSVIMLIATCCAANKPIPDIQQKINENRKRIEELQLSQIL